MARRSSPASVFLPECPSREALCVLGNKWSLLVLRALGEGTCRFTDLHQRVGGISQKMLAQTLRGLEAKGLVVREVFAEIPVRIEYSLAPRAITLVGPIAALCRWAEREGGRCKN